MIDEEKNILKEQPTKKNQDDEATSATPENSEGDGEAATGHNEHSMAKLAPDELTVEQWVEKLSAAEALAAERLDGQQRSLADFQNYKRRTTRDMQLIRQNAAASLLTMFFPILDDLVLALDSLPNSGDGAAWSEGVNMVQRKLVSVLEGEGVTPIEAEAGQEFDPHFHEALVQEEHPEYETDVIIAVVRSGYQLGERVLRPTQVRVAK